ncbi:hypothetical protein PGB90_005441 [Kerria lacca]
MNTSFSVLPRRSIQNVAPHVPLIKFRKGIIEIAKSQKSPQQAYTSKQMTYRTVLEDYQLPLKYRRQPLDEIEIYTINNKEKHFAKDITKIPTQVSISQDVLRKTITQVINKLQDREVELMKRNFPIY